MRKGLLTLVVFLGFNASAQEKKQEQWVVANLQRLQSLNFPIFEIHKENNVGLTKINKTQIHQLRELSHESGSCAGFAVISKSAEQPSLKSHFKKPSNLKSITYAYPQSRADIQLALAEVDATHIEEIVEWLSSYENRYEEFSTANDHVEALALYLESLLSKTHLVYQVDQINHKNTIQKSIRVRLTGSKFPNEIVILGGHHDSITESQSEPTLAPGADDNASGVGSIIEALSVLIKKGQPEKTVEFFLYAAEETGLLGSQEIAKSYKKQKAQVLAVLQLDMTLYPGDGNNFISMTTDYVHSGLTQYVRDLNSVYIGAQTIDSPCEYACSDHSSWTDAGFPAAYPTESSMETFNHNLHTKNDVIDSGSSFDHAALFSKLSIAYLMDLAY